MLDDRVVLLPVHFHRVVGARERPQFFITQPGAAADVVLVRILVEVARRNLDAAQRVAVDVFLRGLSRVVRRVERDVHEKRPLVLLGFADVVDSIVRDDFAPMLAALPKTVELDVVWAPRVRLARQWPVVALGGLIRHATADVSGDLKRLIRRRRDVPFAGEKCLIPGAAHHLWPEVVELHVTCGLLCVGQFFATAQNLLRLLRPPNVPTGNQHVSAGHAHCAAPRAHVVGAGELRAALG